MKALVTAALTLLALAGAAPAPAPTPTPAPPAADTRDWHWKPGQTKPPEPPVTTRG